MARRLAILVEEQLIGLEGNDLRIEAPLALGRGGTLLAQQRIGILGLPRDPIAAGDQLSGLDHRDIGRRHHRLDRLGLGAIAILVLGLGQRDRFHATGHRHRELAGHDALGNRGDAHQPRGAHTVQGHARNARRQAGGIGAKAPDIVGLGALLNGGAHDHVLDGLRLDAGALKHSAHHMAAEHRGFGVVEGAAKRLGQRRAGGGNDNGILGVHDGSSGVGLVKV